MAGVTSITELQIPKKFKDRETSPERTKVWTQPKPKTETRVSVVYYLSRNGQLEHPHFMEVLLSSPQGLYLRDVINRLKLLRGKAIVTMYSWSAKRSYKNGFVWHDLSENDFIYPAQGQEYILKGSEILDNSSTPRPEDDSHFPAITRRCNQSGSSNSIDSYEHRVFKSESFGDSPRKVPADASTQTDDKRRRTRAMREEKAVEEMEGERILQVICHSRNTELSSEESSTPPSDSSLETLMEADGRLAFCSLEAHKEDGVNLTAENYPSGRIKTSSVFMQLLSCGSISLKDCGATFIKD